MKYLSLFVIASLLAGCAITSPANNSPSSDAPELLRAQDRATAVFAAGCFWCAEAGFERMQGVTDAVSGFAGGDTPNPTYEEVSKGTTDYVEAVEVHYDDRIISYAELLEGYWRIFNPTDDGGQFGDRGTQYRAAIFYQTDSQRVQAEKSKQHLADSGIFDKPIVTTIRPLGTFYPAEDYHQDYHKKHPTEFEAYEFGSGRKPFVDRIWKTLKVTIPSQNDLKNKLSPLAYDVTQENGTETAFDNAYYDNHEAGIYVDVVSGEPLFSSLDKFDSGTGWPSFTKPIDTRYIVKKEDATLGASRIEVRSRFANSHLGHVFADGPAPTGLRYCINSAALRFVPLDDMEKEGYSAYRYLFN